ncbi:MAG: AI-2E family transporter [Coprobacillus sp.]
MKATDKMRDLNLKNMIILVTYIAVLILALLNFQVILSFFGTLFDIIQPFIVGFVLAFIFNIPMKLFIKKLPIQNDKLKKTISAILSVLLVVMVIVIVVLVILPQVIDNVKLLIDNMPATITQIEEFLNKFMKQFNASPDIVKKVQEFQETFGDTILSSITSWVPSIASGVSHFATGVVNMFISFVLAIYMLFSKDKLLKQVERVGTAFLKESYFNKFKEVAQLTGSTFENFLAGQLTESFIIGILCYIGCKILDIPYASIAAIVIGFTNIIPYFGPIIGTAIGALLIVFIAPMKAVVFVVFGTLLQQFESNLIYPHVVGSSVGLSALWVLFAVTAGGGLFGIPGMVFGLPTFSVIYELMRRWINKRIKDKETINLEEKTT